MKILSRKNPNKNTVSRQEGGNPRMESVSQKKQTGFHRAGFSLVELLVSMFILMMVMAAMVAVSVAIFRSYGKSKAIKTVMEDVGFAMNSIAKDVRMGKIENTDANCFSSALNHQRACLMVTRNSTQEKICYLVGEDYLAVSGNIGGASCPVDGDASYKKIVDLANTNMTFDATTSGFYAMPTDTETVLTPGQSRGWAEINLNIESSNMETESIHLQTIVSSRDYGWENF